MDCNNLCFRSEQSCAYCKANYIVSDEFYRAKRPANGCWVTGYLVKNKDGEIKGILNKNNHFYELAWILEDTLEKVLSDKDNRECSNCGRFQGRGYGCGEYVNTCMQDGDAYSHWILR